MGHSLKPSDLPPPLRGAAEAVAYDLGELHIILSRCVDIPGYEGRMCSISVKGHKRYPTIEEVSEVLVKVSEIAPATEWSMLWFGDGSVSPTSSTVLYIFEGHQGRPDFTDSRK